MSSLERTILIRAQRSTVFRYFTDSERFATWWGHGSAIEGRVGGAVKIRYPNGIEAAGEVLEIEPEKRILFTFGYASGQPIAPGSTRVEITLADDPEGTRLVLRHELPDDATRDMHLPGWMYQLALFANVAAAQQHDSIARHADTWFEAWREDDADARGALLASCCTPQVSFADPHACVAGLDELNTHIGMARQHMRAASFARTGEPQACQGTALVAWEARTAEDEPFATGTNVLMLAPDGRIVRCVGITSA